MTFLPTILFCANVDDQEQGIDEFVELKLI